MNAVYCLLFELHSNENSLMNRFLLVYIQQSIGSDYTRRSTRSQMFRFLCLVALSILVLYILPECAGICTFSWTRDELARVCF